MLSSGHPDTDLVIRLSAEARARLAPLGPETAMTVATGLALSMLCPGCASQYLGVGRSWSAENGSGETEFWHDMPELSAAGEKELVEFDCESGWLRSVIDPKGAVLPFKLAVFCGRCGHRATAHTYLSGGTCCPSQGAENCDCECFTPSGA